MPIKNLMLFCCRLFNLHRIYQCHLYDVHAFVAEEQNC